MSPLHSILAALAVLALAADEPKTDGPFARRVGGAFRSKTYPITWRYNADHENVRKDFVRDLIDHAHTRGVKVLLGSTPFGHDGVDRNP